MERSSSTFPKTHIFFVPNIKGLAEVVLTWDRKVFAVGDAEDTDAEDMGDAAEMNWKHKVTPDQGDLIIQPPPYGTMNHITFHTWDIYQFKGFLF